MNSKIAIIGGGIAGLTVANSLRTIADVTVFEKSRGVGGRMSTRYADPFYFDHGTQYFTGRSRPFREFLAPFLNQNIVASWEGKVITLARGKSETDRLWFEPHYVAVPNMNSLCKSMAENLAVSTTIEVAPLPERSSDGWHIIDKGGAELGIFDWVISTAPPAQTVKLFGPHLPTDQPLREARLLGCYTIMIGFSAPWKKSWNTSKPKTSPNPSNNFAAGAWWPGRARHGYFGVCRPSETRRPHLSVKQDN
jgi:predicted NAD/FAD-dependent oxidoreductase